MESEAFVKELQTHLRQEMNNYEELKGLPLNIDHEDFNAGEPYAEHRIIFLPKAFLFDV